MLSTKCDTAPVGGSFALTSEVGNLETKRSGHEIHEQGWGLRVTQGIKEMGQINVLHHQIFFYI